jgi:hypothetical protein
MRRSHLVMAAFLCALLVSGCSSMSLEYRKNPRSSERSTPATHANGHGKGKKVGSLGVPPGHLPPPGFCRIWIPGTPPGKQPEPGDCQSLARQVPAGAWLLHRAVDDPRYVDVSVYEEDRPGVLLEVRVFDAETGAFVRIRGER